MTRVIKTVAQKIAYFLLAFVLVIPMAIPDVVMETPWGGSHGPVQTGLACLMVLGVSYLFFKICQWLKLPVDFKALLSKKALLTLVVAYVVMDVTSNLGQMWLESTGATNTANQASLEAYLSTLPPIFVFVVTTFIPAFGEELMCRGLLMDKIFGRYRLVGLVVSSLIFGYLHMPTDLPSLFIYSSSGFILGGLYYRTKNLAYPITLHFISNLIVTIFFYL